MWRPAGRCSGAAATAQLLKGKLSKQWISAPAPNRLVALEHLLGGRAAVRDNGLDGLEEDRLVLPFGVGAGTRRQPGPGDRGGLTGNLKGVGAADGSGQGQLRYRVPQRLALRRAPGLDQVPGRIEGRGII